MNEPTPSTTKKSLDTSEEQETPSTTIPQNAEHTSTAQHDDTAAPSKPEISPFAKQCTLCHKPRNVLIRCQIDDTKKWHFVCPGKCWQGVSGGSPDGDRQHPVYKYGGTWKNKHEYVSAKIKGKAKEDNKDLWNGFAGPHRRPAKRERRGGRYNKLQIRAQDVKIGDDDGRSDIEVSDVSVEDEGEEWGDYKGLIDGGRGVEHVQVKRADEVWEDPEGFLDLAKGKSVGGVQVKPSQE